MITREALAELLESFGDRHVLSVYLAAESTDPAARRSWFIRLKNRTRDERDRLRREASGQLSSFDLAVAHVEEALSAFSGFLPDRGWVGFATPAGLHLADTLPVPPPELLAWDIGPRLTPYVRNLKLRRPVVAVLIDSRSARLFRKDGQAPRLLPMNTTSPRSLISASPLSNSGSLIVGVRLHDSLLVRPHRAIPTCRSIQRHAIRLKIETSWTLGPSLTQQCTRDRHFKGPGPSKFGTGPELERERLDGSQRIRIRVNPVLSERRR